MNNQTANHLPIGDQINRPLVTFALFAYNQEKYIGEAVAGAFAQAYRPLEIILSDDCSTDGTFEIMKEMAAAYVGPHKLVVNRNLENMGVAAHFSKVIETSLGNFVVIAAGDDISLPMRTVNSVQPMIDDPRISFVEVGLLNFTDEDKPAELVSDTCCTQEAVGTPFTLDDYLTNKSPGLTGAARAVRRNALIDFPSLSAECPTEDTPSVLRLLMRGRGLVASGTSLLRRLHGANLSSSHSLLKMNLVAIENQYLCDIDVARRQGWLSDRKAKLLERWARSIIRKRATHIQLNAGVRPPIRLLLAVLFSNKSSIKQKMHIIRASLVGPIP